MRARKSLQALALLALLTLPETARSQQAASSNAAAACDSGVAARYAHAEAMLAANTTPLVLNEAITHHWIGRGRQFWYRRQRPDGAEYVLGGDGGVKRLTFDHVRLAAAASTAAGVAVEAWHLNLTRLEPGLRAMVLVGDKELLCDLGGYTCKVSPGAKADAASVISPDGRQAIFTRDDNLWVRNLQTSVERQLTTDGEAHYAWGGFPDIGLLGVTRQRLGLKFPPFGYSWSPDGRHVVGGRLDEREIKPYPFLESVPADGSGRPRAHWVRQALLGEQGPRFDLAVFDVASGRRIAVALPADPGLPPSTLTFDVLGWSADGKKFYGVYFTDYNRQARLIEANALTGAVRIVISERSSTHVRLNPLSVQNAANVRLINGGREVIWYSERRGWGHLYRYDVVSGKLVNPITSGDWLVRDIVHIDAANQRVFFTGGGREAGNPYRRRFYRAGFDGSDLTLLTPEDADQMVDGPPFAINAMFGAPTPPAPVSPDGRVVVASYSTLDVPPVTVLRSADDGHVIAVLEQADASRLYATGWRAPQAFAAKAADGETDLHGVIYWPRCPHEPKLPVVDSLYAGPQVAIVPHNFSDGLRGGRGGAALAELGFAVVVVDGRGTPLRSRPFQDVSYGNFADPALDDHVAVLRQLTNRIPRMDAKRIGVGGHSLGGYVAARAMLRYPDDYSVGVSSGASHNFHGFYDISQFMAPPDYGKGIAVKPSPDAVPGNYRGLDNAELAKNLKGKLLLAYSDLDENAFPAVTLQFIEALTKANRDYDLLYLSNRSHAFPSDPYFIRRTWDYFVEHLRHETPPANYRIGAASPARGGR